MSVILDKLLRGQKVEWLKLKDVSKYIRGLTYNKSNESHDATGYKVLRANNINLENNQLNFSDVKTVSFDTKVKDNQKLYKDDILISAASGSREHVGKVAFVESNIDYYFGGFMGVIRCSENINPKYLFHIMTSDLFRNYLDEILNTSTINNLNSKVMENFSIPLPQLDIQNKIVKILDTFTALTAELSAELTMREKQYHYYRDKLLTFSDDEVEWKRLEEVFNITAGGDVPKNALSPIQTDEFNIPIISNSMGEKSLYGWTDKSRVNEASITISARGANTGWTNFQNRPIFPIIRLLALTPKIEMNLKYAYYFMKMIENNYKISEAGIPQLTVPMIRDIKIPFPNLTEQNKIANILDKFEILTNSITEGLPKEIAVRQQQFEYYREQLLDFPKLNKDIINE